MPFYTLLRFVGPSVALLTILCTLVAALSGKSMLKVTQGRTLELNASTSSGNEVCSSKVLFPQSTHHADLMVTWMLTLCSHIVLNFRSSSTGLYRGGKEICFAKKQSSFSHERLSGRRQLRDIR